MWSFSPELPCVGPWWVRSRLLLAVGCLLLAITTAVSASPISAAARRTKRGDGNEFFFVKFPLENHVESGRPVRLRCQVNKRENIRYHWEHNNKPLVVTSRRYQEGSDLYIGNADSELDQGVFHCIATNKSSGYSAKSSPYTVKIFWLRPVAAVKLVQPRRVSDIRTGSDVMLRCETRARPPVVKQQIEWFHNFQRLQGTPAQQKHCEILPNGDLRIKAYQKGNAGVYRCQVAHAAGFIMSNIPLAISANDASSIFSVASNPRRYLQYYRRNQVLRLRCPLTMKKDAIGFINWSYRSRLTPKSDVKSFDSSSNSCVTWDDCVLPQKDMFDLRRPPSKDGSRRAGFYMCQLHFMKSSNSKPYVIEVRRAENPPINASNFGLRHSLEKIVPMVGKSFTVRVYLDETSDRSGRQIVAAPRPTFKWICPNGDVVDASTRSSARVRLENGMNLYFETVLPSDSGVYKFSATNLDSTQQADVHVVVAFPPKMTPDSMPDVTWLEGPDNATLRCNVATKSAYPVAKVLWLKDGATLDEVSASPLSFLRTGRDGRLAYSSTSISIPAQARVRLTVDQRSGSVVFRSVMPSDAGTYQCLVQTKGMITVKSNPFQVKVLRRLKIMVIDPQPFLERGVPGKLICIAKGEGPLTFLWLRRNPTTGRLDAISDGRMASRQNTPGKGELDIALVKNEDAGEYMCKVTDRLGAATNTTYNVVVGEKPTIIKVTPSNVTVVAGQTLRLECKAAGDPPPKTSWIRRRANKETESLTLDNYIGVDARQAHRMLFENGTLVIRNVIYDDSGFYQCVVGHKHAMISGPDIYVRVTTRNGDIDGVPGDGFRRRSPLTKTILIVVGCALAYLGLIIALTVYCSLRMVRKRRKYTEAVIAGPCSKAELAAAAAAESQRLMANGEFQVTANNNNMTGGHVSPSASSQYSRSNAAAARDPSIPPYPRSRLIKTASLGKGEFGEVFLARAPVLCAPDGSGEPEILVTVKTLQHSKDRRLTASFFEQLEMFHKLDHRSVVQLLGACLDSEPRCFLLEFCAWGDLKQFLRAMRRGQQQKDLSSLPPPFLLADGSTAQALSHSQRMHICAQVANGMEHVSNLRFVHKDLAARNVLISPTLDVKISHLGLSQSVYAEDYFPMRLPGSRNSRPVPIRWMPPEVILKGAYSPETDVWSFGIFVYEVLSLGETPLRKHSHSEILSAAAAGRLSPEMPPGCPSDLQALLMRCWSANPVERPSFSEISVLVGGMVVECDI